MESIHLPPDWPSIEWVRSFYQYRHYETFQELDANMLYFIRLIKLLHNNGEMYIQSKRIVCLFAMEVVMLNKHFVGNPEFDKFARQLAGNIDDNRSDDDPIRIYKQHFRKIADLEYKIQAQKRYIEFIFSRTLGKDIAKRIADFYN